MKSQLAELNLIGCSALTRLPELLGQLAALTMLGLSSCHRLTRLPLSVAFLPDTLNLVRSQSLVFPPLRIARQGIPAIKAFLVHDPH